MATKTREITIKESKGTFSILKNVKTSKDSYNFEGVSALRQLLSNEKARMLDTIKTKKPSSIYALAKELGRDFKSVINDLKNLERFGFVELVKEKTKGRVRHKPEIAASHIIINLYI